MLMKRAKIAVLVSGGGTNLQALIDAEKSGIIKSGKIALVISNKSDAYALERAANSSADYVMIDSGAGSGKKFDWSILKDFKRDYFLAGGLDSESVGEAIRMLEPFAVDVSSGVETDGIKDEKKMAEFIKAVKYGGKYA